MLKLKHWFMLTTFLSFCLGMVTALDVILYKMGKPLHYTTDIIFLLLVVVMNVDMYRSLKEID